MPYTNVPDDKQDKMHNCVMKVMDGDPSLDKENAIAICYRSVVEGKSLDEATTEVKAGARHNKSDQAKIDKWHKAADELKQDMADLGAVIDAPVEGKINKAEDMLVACGDNIKALGNGKIGGYLIRFGNEEEPDLSTTRDFFTEKTYFGAHQGDGVDVTIHHGQLLKDTNDPEERKIFEEIANHILPPVKTQRDKVGLFAETILNMADEYENMVYTLAEKGKLKWSSGAVSHLVQRTPMKNGTHRIDRWIIGEAALTPTAAEPRLGAVIPLKSLSGATSGQSVSDDTTAKTIVSDTFDSQQGNKTMPDNPAVTAEEVKTLRDDLAAIKKQNEELLAELRKPALPTVPAQVKAVGDDLPFKSIGEQLQAIVAVKLQTPGREMAANKLDAVTKAVKALGANEEVGSDGGFALQPTFVPGIWKRTYETGILASRCRTQMIGDNSNTLVVNAVAETSRATGSRYGGVQAYWLGAGGTITASRPKLRQIELKAKKIAVLMYATDELLQDTAAMTDLANTAVPEELGFMLDDAIWEGTGAGQPIGFINSAAVVSQAKEAGQAAATIVMENLIKMWSRLWPRSQNNAVWYYNTDAFPQIMSLGLGVGVGGVPVFLPPGGLSGSPFATLFGRPLIAIEQASTVGTVADIVLADLSQYVIGTKGDVQQATSIHVAFLTDEMAFRWTLRVDGQPIWDAPLTPFKGTNTQSPFVTLATRS